VREAWDFSNLREIWKLSCLLCPLSAGLPSPNCLGPYQRSEHPVCFLQYPNPSL